MLKKWRMQFDPLEIKKGVNRCMTQEQFIKKYSCDNSLVYYYRNKFPQIKISKKQINFQQLDNIIQTRLYLRNKVQNILSDKTGNDIKEFFNNKTAAYGFVNRLFRTMENKLLVKEITVIKYIKIINKYERVMKKIHIKESIFLNEEIANEVLKISHEKNIINDKDVLNGCDYFTYYPNTKIVSIHIKDPLFWVDLSLQDFLSCYEEIKNKKVA